MSLDWISLFHKRRCTCKLYTPAFTKLHTGTSIQSSFLTFYTNIGHRILFRKGHRIKTNNENFKNSQNLKSFQCTDSADNRRIHSLLPISDTFKFNIRMRFSTLHNPFTCWKQSNIEWKRTPSIGSRTDRKGRSTVAEGFRLVIGSVSSPCVLSSFLSLVLSCGIVYPLFALCIFGRTSRGYRGRRISFRGWESLFMSHWVSAIFVMSRRSFGYFRRVFRLNSSNYLIDSLSSPAFLALVFFVLRFSTTYGD